MKHSLSSKLYILPIALLSITFIGATFATLPSTSADPSPVDDTINITVDSSCTMGQTVLSNNTNLNPGETGTIGSSRISAYCNDSDGYAIYAIGFTNGEYGNTYMMNATNSNASSSTSIPTGTSSTLGNDSYWNMKLTPGTATTSTTFIPTIENNFTTNTLVPDDYTLVASYPSTTIPQTKDPLESGSYFTATYEAHISTTQPAGTYTGQVQYVMVHPTSAPKPEIPLPYMQETTAIKNKLKNIGDTTKAIDRRDNKEYWITKLSDGNIWMTQNLDLDLDSTRTYTSEDTDLPAGSSWKPAVSTYPTGYTSWGNYTRPQSYDPGDRYWNGVVKYAGGTIDSDTTTSGDLHYHIGNYYNWTAAVATNDSSSYTTNFQDINQSICPAGWRLPTYSGDKSYYNLINAQGITAGISGNIQKNPTYFVYSGYWFRGSGPVGNRGFCWSSVVQSNLVSYRIGFFADGAINAQNSDGRDYGFSVRCVAR